jgi:hypothetical protein
LKMYFLSPNPPCKFGGLSDIFVVQWKRINCKQSARWQHLSRLKASAFLFEICFC